MAIVTIPASATMNFKVQTGVSAAGAPVYRIRSYGNLKLDATGDNIYGVALALGMLQKFTLISVGKQVVSQLVEG